jgi:hypothetical protein
MKKVLLPDPLRKFIYKVRHWETWHWLVKYIPMIPFWIGYCLKARSLWFFTPSNPTLTFGGYEGESKMEMYKQLPEGTCPKTILIQASMPEHRVKAIALSEGFSFPLAVKPDVGRMGFMFRRINSMKELIHYHENMKVDYLLQEFIHYPLEVSVFYYRFPHQKVGTITGFVRKEHLSVTGDGVSTLLQLMMNYPRVQFRLDEMKTKHEARLHDIIPAGENYILCQALNLSRGGKLISLEHEKDEKLLSVIDNLSRRGNFYFGRYDIKCASIEALKNGNKFSVLEFNGSGAEPHHVYGNGNSLVQAVKILLRHWRILYEISVENHKKGISYWSFTQGLNHMIQVRRHIKLLRKLEFSSTNLRHEIITQNLKDKADILQPYGITVNKSVQT